MIPRGYMCGCAQEVASGPLKACLALVWESERLSTRKVIRSSSADHVGSYSSDLVFNRRNEDYPGEGECRP